MTKENTLELITDLLEFANTDLDVAHRVIELYGELNLMIGRELKECVKENIRLRGIINRLSSN